MPENNLMQECLGAVWQKNITRTNFTVTFTSFTITFITAEIQQVLRLYGHINLDNLYLHKKPHKKVFHDTYGRIKC